MKTAFVTLGVKAGRGTEYALTMVAEDCCWGLIHTRNLPAVLLAAASQMEDAFFFDLSIEPPENLEVLKPDLIVYPLIPIHYKGKLVSWMEENQDYLRAHYSTASKEQIMEVIGPIHFHSIMSDICKGIPKIVLAVPPGYMKEYAGLKPNPFCVVYSEPEAVFSDFHVTTKDELVEWRKHSKGTAWVDDDIFHKREPLKTCIHDIRGTNWDLVPPSYWSHYRCVIYQITRGCPWRCNFCVWGGSTVTDRTFRMRPAEQVATDLINLRRTINKHKHLTGTRYNVGSISAGSTSHPIILYTLSAQLSTDIGWIREFQSLMKGAPYPFQGNITLHDLTKEKLELLAQAGMYLFVAGLEALTDPLLMRMNKPHNFEDVIRGIKILNESGVHYHLKLISGGYGETKAEIKEILDNIEIMRKRGIEHSNIKVGGPIIYYKGTVIGENPPEELVYDSAHGFRQKHIHTKEWIEVTKKLREYNLLDESYTTYPQKRLVVKSKL